MAFWWIFRMGYSARSNDQRPQTMYKFLGEARPTDQQLRAEGGKPHYATLWKQVSCSDPWGYDTGTTPDFLVGRYGNWWGAQWSGGRECGFDGIGPTGCPYLDALDRVALEHDIECWIAGEVNRNRTLGIQAGDRFRVQEVFWENSVGPREYAYDSQLAPHQHASDRLPRVPSHLRERLKASIYLYTILASPVDVNDIIDKALLMGKMDTAGKAMMSRPDLGCGAAIRLLGLSNIPMSFGDLMRILRGVPGNNIPLSLSDVHRIKVRLRELRSSDPVVRGILEQMK
jgi:hypothetical protein